MNSGLTPTIRHWLILSKIPRYPNTIGTAQIRSFLATHGHEVSPRMIQRDLESLSSLEYFPLCSEVSGRSNRWFWPPGSSVLSLPSMDVSVALSFILASKYLQKIFPRHVLTELSPYFHQAEKTLSDDNFLEGKWQDKVAVIHDGPDISRDDEVSEIESHIYEALFKEKQLRVSYKARGSSNKEYRIHPLGIVSKSRVIYLVGTVNSFEDIRQFSLGRFVDAEVLEDSCVVPAGFNLQDYIQNQGQFQYPITESASLVELRVSPEFVFFFHENEIGKNQKITELDDGHFTVTAYSLLTEELEWWLLGRSNHVQVIKPQLLNTRISEKLQCAVNNYNNIKSKIDA